MTYTMTNTISEFLWFIFYPTLIYTSGKRRKRVLGSILGLQTAQVPSRISLLPRKVEVIGTGLTCL